MTIQHMPELDRPNYSVADAASFLTVTKSYIHQLCRSGELESFSIGSRRIIPASALKELIEKGYQSRQPEVDGCDGELEDGQQCLKSPISGTNFCWSHTRQDR